MNFKYFTPWQKDIYDCFNKQEGQKYPCSNQIVCNAFFTHNLDLWRSFVEENKENIIIRNKDSIVLNNGEKWIHFISPKINCRGYRFYKVKIDGDWTHKDVTEYILPYCGIYCCELNFI